MVLLVDNYDSFTYNLADYLLQLGVGIKIFRNDDPFLTVVQREYDGVIFSPGPGRPQRSGNLSRLIAFYEDKLPLLGICLGHQAIGQHYGASLVRAGKPMHGKRSRIYVGDDYLFASLPESFMVVRYHSLILQEPGTDLETIAHTSGGEIMAIRHRVKNIRGLQFHPEAILTEHGKKILKNWILYNGIS